MALVMANPREAIDVRKSLSKSSVLFLFVVLYLTWCVVNASFYYRSVACDRNYDAYGPYLGRVMILNFPMRLADQTVGFSARIARGLGICDQGPAGDIEAALLLISFEILLVDFALGTAFWLTILLIAFRPWRRHQVGQSTTSTEKRF